MSMVQSEPKEWVLTAWALRMSVVEGEPKDVVW